MITKGISYLVISDVHLNHPRTPTSFIVNNLNTFFNNYENESPLSKVDMIFIDGDLFDQLIDVSNDDLFIIMGFINMLIWFCERNNIKLRVLEGTPLHDRRQSRMFEILTQVSRRSVDVRWVSTLEIEYIKDFDINILYVPDEFKPTCGETLILVKELLNSKGLDKVDIAHMHGSFGYQREGIPGVHDTHDEKEYTKLVRYAINIGHEHVYSKRGIITAQGSFDRLTHGDETKKGGCLTTIKPNGSVVTEFLVNKGAKIYKTFEPSSSVLKEAMQELDGLVASIPDNSHVRIKASRFHPLIVSLPEIKKLHPMIYFSKLCTEEIARDESKFSINEDFVVVEIREENVIELIQSEIPDNSIKDRNALTSYLENIKKS